MASLGDLTLFINAETGRAQRDIDTLGRDADRVVSKKRDIGFSIDKARNDIKNFKRDLQTVGEVAKASYKVAKMEGLFDDEIEVAEGIVRTTKKIPGAVKEASNAGNVLNRSFQGAAAGVSSIVGNLAKVGFALYGIQQITGTLQQAFGGLFNATIGQAVRLEEQILKTQTALASTNDVFVNGQKITEPYEAIVALTGSIEKRIESIRQRSLDLAGVTSAEVVEVFGMVSQQVGAIGGDLKDAEDLAIAFSGALGTFGIPLYQARQEIGSILRGSITEDSYLAKALGIRNEDVKKAKQSTDGVVGFLQQRLKVAVAGQAIAAKSFSGVSSNIRDFIELTTEAFGKPLVEPLISGLTTVYDLLVSIKDQTLGAAGALGSALGGAAQILGGYTRQQFRTQTGGDAGIGQFGDRAGKAVENLSAQIEALAAELQQVFSNLSLLVATTLAKLATGLGDLAKGFASLQVEVFKQLAQSFQNILALLQPTISGVSSLLSLYGDFLQLPLVEYLSSVGAQFKLLETIGVNSFVKLVLVAGALASGFKGLAAAATAVFAVIQRGIAGALAFAGTALTAFGTALQALIQRLAIANPALTKLATQLNLVGASATKGAASMGTAAGAANGLGMAMKGLMVRMLAFNALLLVVQVTIAAVVDAFGRWQRAQDKIASDKRAKEAIRALNNELKDVDENSSAALRAQKELNESVATSKLAEQKNAFIEADKAVSDLVHRIEQLKKQRDRLKEGKFTAQDIIEGGKYGNEINLDKAEKELQKAVGRRFAAEKEYLDDKTAYEKKQDEKRLEDEVKTRAKNLGELNEKLAKQQKDLARQVANDEFAARSELARKQVEVFTAEENVRISKIEEANRLKLKGEEGAAAEFLRGLNTYLADKERGELDIEAKRRQAVIATNELEQELENYRYSISEKILELQKQGAKFLTDAADYALMRAKQEAEARRSDGGGGGSGDGIAQIADSSLNANAKAWLSVIRFAEGTSGPNGYRTMFGGGLFNDMSKHPDMVVRKNGYASAAAGAYQFMPDTWAGVGGGAMTPIRQDKAAVALARRRGVDISSAPFTRENVAKLAPEWASLPNMAGNSAYDQPVKRFNDLQSVFNRAAGAPGTSAAATFAPPSTAGIEAARRQANELNQNLIEADKKAKEMAKSRELDQLIEKIAPVISVKRIEDANRATQELMASMNASMDPARVAIMAEARSKETLYTEELKKALENVDEIAQQYGQTSEEIEKKIKDAFYGKNGTKERLDAETEALLAQLDLRNKLQAVQSLVQDTRNNRLSTDQNMVTGAADLAAGTEFSTFDQRRIQAMGAIESRRMAEEARTGGPLTGETLAAFEQFKESELVNAEKMAALDGLQQRFQQLGEIASGVGNSIGTAFTQGFADILTGAASVQDVLGNMFQGIADSFMQMAQKIIADMIKMLVYKALLGLFGGQQSMLGGLTPGGSAPGGAPGGFPGLDSLVGTAPSGGFPGMGGNLFKMAKGGIVNGPTPALIGEGGMNEAVVPLPNGKAIPVDFGGKKAGGDVNTTINVSIDQGGNAQTEMSGEDASRLGKAIDGAVKRVIMEERRAGGLLYNGRR